MSFGLIAAQSEVVSDHEQRITSQIDSTMYGELVLIQEFVVDVDRESVWNAYTTKEGWESWAVPLAEVDLKINGRIKTSYQAGAVIGDSSTNILHIINYVPHRLLTLQEELTKNFPEFMQADAKDLYNVIYFEAVAKIRRK